MGALTLPVQYTSLSDNMQSEKRSARRRGTKTVPTGATVLMQWFVGALRVPKGWRTGMP